MKVGKLIYFSIIGLMRESKRNFINIFIITIIFTMLLVITSLYITLENATDNMLINSNKSINIKEITLFVNKNELLSFEKAKRVISEKFSHEGLIEHVELVEESMNQIEIKVHIKDYHDNAYVTSSLDLIDGISVRIEENTLSSLEILRIVENVTKYMMYGVYCVIFLTLILSQSYSINEKRYEYARLKAFGYQNIHITSMVAINVLISNIMAFALALIVTSIVFNIDFNYFDSVKFAVKIEMLRPLGMASVFILIVIISGFVSLVLTKKINGIEPMILLKEAND